MPYATNRLWWRLTSWCAGAIAGLLVARLVARLLAGRVENASLALLYTLTDPLVTPLRALDAGQPRFGAVLELSTLALLLLCTIIGYSAARLVQRWLARQQ